MAFTELIPVQPRSGQAGSGPRAWNLGTERSIVIRLDTHVGGVNQHTNPNERVQLLIQRSRSGAGGPWEHLVSGAFVGVDPVPTKSGTYWVQAFPKAGTTHVRGFYRVESRAGEGQPWTTSGTVPFGLSFEVQAG